MDDKKVVNKEDVLKYF